MFKIGDKVYFLNRICTVIKSLSCHKLKVKVPKLENEWGFGRDYVYTVAWKDVRKLTKLERALK